MPTGTIALQRISTALDALVGPAPTESDNAALERIATALERLAEPGAVLPSAVKAMAGCRGCGQPYMWPHRAGCTVAAAEN